MKRKIKRIKRRLKNTKIIPILLVILIITLIIVFYLIGKNIIMTQKEYDYLVEESININNDIDIKNDQIKEINNNKNCKTKDNILLENAIEEFSNDYIKELNKIIKSIKDEKYTNLLITNNYQTDGPEFTNSFEYINNKTKEIEDLTNEIDTLTSKTYYTKYIKEKTTNKRIIERYNILINNIISKSDIKLLKNDLKNMRNILKTSYETLYILSVNRQTWHVENNEIVFINQDIKNQYENNINILKR